jgi:hypothetical protein
MALSLIDISAYTSQYIVPKSTDTIFLNSPVFTRLSSRNMERFSGGLYIQRPIIYNELNGDAIGRGDAMNIDFVTTDTALVNDLKVYYVNITLFGFDSMKNDGPAAIFSQVETKFQNASMKMAKLLATNMYLDHVTAGRQKHLDGLREWIDDGNQFPTIGGITRSDIVPVTSPSTVGGLNAFTNNLGAGAFTLQTLNTAYGNAWFGADHPDLVVATQNGWNLIWNALQPQQRYYDTESDVASTGFQSFRFNGAEVVVDKYMPTGTNGVMYLLNSKYLEWYFSTNKKFQFGFTGFKESNNSLDVAGQYLVGSNIVIPNPRAFAKILSSNF